jgi:hypothetical protein
MTGNSPLLVSVLTVRSHTPNILAASFTLTVNGSTDKTFSLNINFFFVIALPPKTAIPWMP